MKKIKNDVYLQSNNIYLENGTLIMVSSFIVWTSIGLLLLFPLFGAGLGYFSMCFLCLGFKKIVLDLIDKSSPKIENVFAYFKDSLSAFCLKVATTVIVLLWSLLFRNVHWYGDCSCIFMYYNSCDEYYVKCCWKIKSTFSRSCSTTCWRKQKKCRFWWW